MYLGEGTEREPGRNSGLFFPVWDLLVQAGHQCGPDTPVQDENRRPETREGNHSLRAIDRFQLASLIRLDFRLQCMIHAAHPNPTASAAPEIIQPIRTLSGAYRNTTRCCPAGTTTPRMA